LLTQGFGRANEIDPYEFTIDLGTRDARRYPQLFRAIDSADFQRHCLLEGLDDIGLTLLDEAVITSFDKQRPA